MPPVIVIRRAPRGSFHASAAVFWQQVKGESMVRREKVISLRGRRWVSGALPAEEYFAQAREQAREQARRTVADRVARGDRPARAINGS